MARKDAPETIPGTRVFCGARLDAGFDHQFFRLDCTSCGQQVMGQPATPAQVRDREIAAMLQSVKLNDARDYRQIRRGVCPECRGRLSTQKADMRDGLLPDSDRFRYGVSATNAREYNLPFTYSVVSHRASVAFHWGTELTVRPRVFGSFTNWSTTVVGHRNSTRPARRVRGRVAV